MRRLIGLLVVPVVLVLGACSVGGGDDSTGGAENGSASAGDSAGDGQSSTATSGRSATGEFEFPAAPEFSADDVGEVATDDVFNSIGSLIAGGLDTGGLDQVVESGDPRFGWVLADLLRFSATVEQQDDLVSAFERLTGTDPSQDPSFETSPWLSITNHLIAWDLPEPPEYRAYKDRLFSSLEPGWEPFFADEDSNLDLRLISWGGVLIDDRPEGDRGPCLAGCIPALDDPELTDVAGGDWYPDDRLVFGVEVGDETVAFPRNVMEVHEMVNITIGERRLGIPYCTLCGSAQAYFTDQDKVRGNTLVLRTSGLLSRSNKVMYELRSKSVFDTFTGEALTGPLREQGVMLEQAAVVTTSWGEWKAEHPDTKIVAEDGGLGRDYPLDPLGGRDDNGPIFPVGPVDPRQPAQELVLGVTTPDGEALAFPAQAARDALAEGKAVELDGIVVTDDAGGLVASTSDGEALGTHESFWFAWSQFNPGTALWEA